MTRRLVSGVVVGALAAAFAGSVAAQKADPRSYMPGVAGCNAENCGYVLSATGTPENNVVKSGAYNGALGLSGNLCWRTGYWAPSMAIEACDPDLVPKPPPPPAPRAHARVHVCCIVILRSRPCTGTGHISREYVVTRRRQRRRATRHV
jgi:hypothetical protein